MAASNTCPSSPLDVDDSVHCGSPGKIMDALTLHETLKLHPEEQVFYGAGNLNINNFKVILSN